MALPDFNLGVQLPFGLIKKVFRAIGISQQPLAPQAMSGAKPVGEIYIGHGSLNPTELVRKAEKRILLHAAFYPKYTDTEIIQSYHVALQRNSFLSLEVIFTDDESPWFDEFVKVLRPNYETKQLIEEINANIEVFLNLKKRYVDKVKIYKTQVLPLVPIVIIDDTILVGHYAHSPILAPNGYWIKTKVDTSTLLEKATNCSIGAPVVFDPPIGSSEACFRYIAEFIYAKEQGKSL